MSKYQEHIVVSDLNKKNDLRVENGVIKVLVSAQSKGDVGIKSKGKIDFLVKHCQYVKTYVPKF